MRWKHLDSRQRTDLAKNTTTNISKQRLNFKEPSYKPDRAAGKKKQSL